MSEVSKWITSLGKAFDRYDGVFEANGVENMALLGLLEIEDMVSDLGVTTTHARMIYHRYKKQFPDGKTENLKPSVVKKTTNSKSKSQAVNDEKKTDKNKLDTKSFAGIFPQEKMLETLLKFARGEAVVANSLNLLHGQLQYLLKLQKNPPRIEHRGFLSHVQEHSSDLCRSLKYGLEKKQTSVWYDMTAGRLDALGMAKGIATSRYFVLIATKNYFQRPWTIYELLIAHFLSKPIIVAVEADSRHGGMTFDEFFKIIPNPWEFLKVHEIMKIERRGDFWQATLNELNKRLNKQTNDERKEEDALGGALQKVNYDDGKPKGTHHDLTSQALKNTFDAKKMKEEAEQLLRAYNADVQRTRILETQRRQIEIETQRRQREINDRRKKVERERHRASFAVLDNEIKQVQFDAAMAILGSSRSSLGRF